MRKSRFLKLIESTFTEIRQLTATKGEEYSNTAKVDADQLANFKRQAADLGMTQEQILSVYLNKHLDGIKSYVRTGVQHSEPIVGRIDDAILYLLLFKAMVVDKAEEANNPT